MPTINPLQRILIQHETRTQKFLKSPSNALQQLAFDTLSSHNPQTSKNLKKMGQLPAAVGASLPDIAYLNLIRDIELFLNAHPELTPIQKQPFENKLSQLKQSLPIATLGSAIVRESSAKKRKLLEAALVKELSKRAESLKKGESLLIPSGWMEGNVGDVFHVLTGVAQGHAVQIELTKGDGDELNLTLYNTGAESGRHATFLENEVLKTHPHFYSGKLDRQFYSTFLPKIVSLIGNKKATYFHQPPQGTELYRVLKNQFGLPESHSNIHTDQGNIGNCTKKSVQVWFHPRGADVEPVYQKFRLERLQRRHNEVASLTQKKRKFTYENPIIYIDSPLNFKNPLKIIIQLIARILFLGSTWKSAIKIQSLNTLLQQAEVVEKKRLKKTDSLLE